MSKVEEKYVCSAYDDPVFFRASDVWLDAFRRETVCEFVVKREKKGDLVIPVPTPVRAVPSDLEGDSGFDATVQITEDDIIRMTHDYQDYIIDATRPVII